MDLQLVDGGLDLSVIQQILQHVLLEVAHADGANAALLVQGLKGLPGGEIGLLLEAGPVHQVLIHIVQAQALERRVKGAEGVVVAVVGVPQLGAQEDLIAGQTALADTAADALFIHVDHGGVDLAIAHSHRVHHAAGGLTLVVGQEATQTLGGDLHPIVQLKSRDHCFSPLYT